MGLLKKINKPSLQSVYRRKVAEAKLKGDDDQEQLSSAQFIVTSYPKEYSDTSCPGCTSSTTSTVDDNTDSISTNNKQIDASSPPDSNENSGGWSWLISCWGSSFLGNKQTDDRTYESTSSGSNEEDDDGVDGGSGDSSHSMSRIDTVLNLGKPDDVSDITSAASVDDSLSDSEDEDDEEEDMSGSGSR